MKISLVICTKNRAKRLSCCLSYVARIKCSWEWEVIVVNNASTDHTEIVLDEFAGKTSVRFRRLYESLVGTGFAKNTGWRLAEGEYIAFIDDDCYPQEDYLEQVIACLDEGPWGFVGGRVLLFDPTDYPITIQTSEVRKEYNAFGYIAPGEIHGANFAFRRSALEAVMGFDPMFGAGTRYPCEDVDVLARILGAGWTGLYDPRPVVYHHHQRKGTAVSKLVRTYDRGRGAFYAKCMMKPALRKHYLYNWARHMRYQPIMSILRELGGSLEYWVKRSWRWFSTRFEEKPWTLAL